MSKLGLKRKRYVLYLNSDLVFLYALDDSMCGNMNALLSVLGFQHGTDMFQDAAKASLKV